MYSFSWKYLICKAEKHHKNTRPFFFSIKHVAEYSTKVCIVLTSDCLFTLDAASLWRRRRAGSNFLLKKPSNRLIMPKGCIVCGCSNRYSRATNKSLYQVPEIAVHNDENAKKPTKKKNAGRKRIYSLNFRLFWSFLISPSYLSFELSSWHL